MSATVVAAPSDEARRLKRRLARTGRAAFPPPMGRQPALDGIRGCAVLLVMLDHTDALPWGWVGVDVFFALSGFLITTLLFEEHGRKGRVSLKSFYARRARRLLPALFLLLAFLTVANTRFGLYPAAWPLWKQITTTVLYLNNWVMYSGLSPLGPLTLTWSLAQEEQFYLVWPILLVVLWKLRSRSLVVLLFLAAAVGGIYWGLPHLHFDKDPNNYYNVYDRFGELLVGCAAAVLRRYRITHWLLRWSLVGLACCYAIYWFPSVVGYDLRPRVIGAVGAAALLVLHVVTGPRSLLSRVLSLPPLRYVGRISYGLYLYHMAILALLVQAVPGISWGLQTVILLPVSIAVADVSWRFIESKFVAAGRPLPRGVIHAEALRVPTQQGAAEGETEGEADGEPSP